MIHKVMQEFGMGTLYPALLIVLCISNYEKGLNILRQLMTHEWQSNQKLNTAKINKNRYMYMRMHLAESQGKRNLIKLILSKEKKTTNFLSCIKIKRINRLISRGCRTAAMKMK